MADMYGDYGDYNGYGTAYQASFGYGRGPQGGGGGGGAYNPYPPHGPPQGYGAGAFNSDPGYQQSPLDAEVAAVIHEMRNEISSFDAAPEYSEQYRNAKRLLVLEVNKLESNTDPEWLEVDIEKQIKLVKKVLIPAFRYPRFNFIGKVIGPKGVTLQNIAKTFKCHVYVLGRGSSRDKAKEQELLATGDPQYAHFNGPLHVKIETTAPPALAYKRVAGVLEVLEELLKPVKESYIEGITPKPESMQKDANNEEGNNDGEEGVKKEPAAEESKIKIEKDYGPDLEVTKTPMSSSRGGSHFGGSGSFSRGGPPRGAPRGGGRGAPRGGFNSERGSREGGPGGPMRGRGGMGNGGNAHFSTPGYGGMPPPMGRGGGPFRGRGGGERGFGGSRGGGDRGFGSSGRGRGGDRGRYQPY